MTERESSPPASDAVTLAKPREDLKPIRFPETIRDGGIAPSITGTLPSPTYDERPTLPPPAPILEDTVMMERPPMERPTRREFPVQRFHSSRPPMPIMVAPAPRPQFPTVITRPQKGPSVMLAVTVAFALGVVAASGLAFFLAGHA